LDLKAYDEFLKGMELEDPRLDAEFIKTFSNNKFHSGSIFLIGIIIIDSRNEHINAEIQELTAMKEQITAELDKLTNEPVCFYLKIDQVN
jgi:hypothetical protein